VQETHIAQACGNSIVFSHLQSPKPARSIWEFKNQIVAFATHPSSSLVAVAERGKRSIDLLAWPSNSKAYDSLGTIDILPDIF
jgi:hypothetical protein